MNCQGEVPSAVTTELSAPWSCFKCFKWFKCFKCLFREFRSDGIDILQKNIQHIDTASQSKETVSIKSLTRMSLQFFYLTCKYLQIYVSLQLIVSFLLLFCTGIPGCNQAPVLCRHRRYGKGLKDPLNRPGLLSVVQLRCTLSMLRYEISVSPASVPALRKHMDASPKSSIWLGFSCINHPFWGSPHFMETPKAVVRSWNQHSVPCAVLQVTRVTLPRPLRPRAWGVLGVVQLSNSPHS